MGKLSIEVFQAFRQGKMSATDSWKEIVVENFSFIGSMDQAIGLYFFKKLNEGFIEMIQGIEMKQAVEAGNFIITQIIMKVAIPSYIVIKSWT